MTQATTTDRAEHDDLIPLAVIGLALARSTGDDRWRDLTANLLTGGKSNLTFELSSAAGQLILRRPPTGPLLPRAHDMAREARVQRALWPTGVPVAEIVLEDSGDLLGVPTYVMRKVPGHVIRGELPDGYATDSQPRRAMAFAYVDTLAELHSVDPAGVGLGDYGRLDGYAERQVRRWTGQWRASQTTEVPEVDELSRRLTRSLPPTSSLSLVHGDYRLDNCVLDVDDPGQVNAVLDWELSTLGDPLSDLGSMLLFWREPGERHTSVTPGVSHEPGFPSRNELITRYAAVTQRDLDGLVFYEALAHFKFAVIVQGIAARADSGAMAGQHFGDLDEEVRGLAEQGLAVLA